MERDGGIDDCCHIGNTLVAHLGAFILSSSNRIMNSFVREINGFLNKNVYYADTDSLHTEKNLGCVTKS